jgi:undecaprenyl phosphate N,N'-diacetylbacillosamine 1-phosphate transferase
LFIYSLLWGNEWMIINLKRIVDLFLSFILLITLSPIFILIAILIKLDSNGPVLFKQGRVGEGGKLFKIYKFRTMVNNFIGMGLDFNLKKDDSRITYVGGFLRKWSLDELPQIINIIKGEMSFVGPRPALEYQVKLYNDFQRTRLLMKPGITGWAQVNGRNSLTWEERIYHDVWYVMNFSLSLDLEIIIKTIKVTLLNEGLYGKDGVNNDFTLTTDLKMKNIQ